MRRRHLLAVLAGSGAVALSGLAGCVTTRSLAQGTGEKRRVPVRAPDDEAPFTLGELGGAVRAAGARVLRVETVGTLAQLAYEPAALSRDESVVVVADAFARHVTSGQETSRLGAVIVDSADRPVADFFVLARWVDDLEAGRLTREAYRAKVRGTIRPRAEHADGGRP